MAYMIAALCDWTVHLLHNRCSVDRPAWTALLMCNPICNSEELAKGTLQEWIVSKYQWNSHWATAGMCIRRWCAGFTEDANLVQQVEAAVLKGMYTAAFAVFATTNGALDIPASFSDG